MPDITNPPEPRPKKIVFSNNTFSFITCGCHLSENHPVKIFDYVGGLFAATPDGTYDNVSVSDGHATLIAD